MKEYFMNELIFGVAYYSEYEHENRMDIDFQMMKKAGINTIRIAESTWSTWEPVEGQYDFSILKKTLDKATEYGINVIVGTPTYEEGSGCACYHIKWKRQIWCPPDYGHYKSNIS